MNVISLDAEYNQPSTKTIEIGAAVYNSKSGELVDTFQIYVNPNEPIQPFITELTGIDDAKVATGVSILEAYEQLKAFHKKHKCFKNPILWGSGVRNDSGHIHTESGVKEENFMGFRVVDAKTLYQSIQIYNNKLVKGGLHKACDTVGIGWDNQFGPEHRALPDAHNTFRIWHHMMSAGKIGG